MANIMDYLEWRGDLNFLADAFNEVDNLILAQLVYVDFAGIVPGPEEDGMISLKEASKRFWEGHDRREVLSHVSMTKSAPFLMEKMAQTDRFQSAQLYGYINDVSDEEQSQFSVVCIRLSDESLYVAFSGTDDTIVGWRENFNMGFLDTTPGQLKAVDYLNAAVKESDRIVRVGGHSKGGNLAVYASVKCKEQVRQKIVSVYNNDGPGFSREMIESEAYQSMQPKISTIMPESSIVGMLLVHQGDYEVVKSENSGAQQHDVMSWNVMGKSPVYVEQVALKSVMLDETLKNWLYQLSNEERQQLVDAAFMVLKEANIKTVDDFYNSKWKVLQELIRAQSRLPEETQKLFLRAVRLLWKSGKDIFLKKV